MNLIKAGSCATIGICWHNCCDNCEHLTSASLCDIFQGADWPHGCSIYPHNPMALEHGCTIYFIDQDTGDIINADNYLSYPDDIKRLWLDMVIP